MKSVVDLKKWKVGNLVYCPDDNEIWEIFEVYPLRNRTVACIRCSENQFCFIEVAHHFKVKPSRNTVLIGTL